MLPDGDLTFVVAQINGLIVVCITGNSNALKIVCQTQVRCFGKKPEKKVSHLPSLPADKKSKYVSIPTEKRVPQIEKLSEQCSYWSGRR
jgi:hypothetical protein